MKREQIYKLQPKTGNGFNCEDGDNQIKLVSEFEPMFKHFDPEQQRSYICVGKEDGCPGCAKGLKVRPTYLAGIIDRTDGKVKIGKFGGTATQKMMDYAKKSGYEYDVIPSYDFIITKSGKLLTTKYDVIASRQDTKLTPAEQLDMDEKMNQISLISIIEKMKDKMLDEIGMSNSSRSAVKSTELPIESSETQIGYQTTCDDDSAPILDEDGNVIPF